MNQCHTSGDEAMPKMYGCNSSFIKGLPLEQSLPFMVEAGFTHINMDRDVRQRFLFSDERMARLKALLDQYPIKVDWFHAPYDKIPPFWTDDGELRGAAMGALCYAIRQVAQLGARSFIVHCVEPRLTPEVNADEAKKYAAEVYHQLVEVARPYGLNIAIENLGMPQSNVINQYLMEQIPELGFCLDVGHANIHGLWELYLEEYAPRIKALHLHDNDAESDQHLNLGEGSLDWAWLGARLNELGYQGVWSLEAIAVAPIDSLDLGAVYADGLKRVKRVSQGLSPLQ
jgi:sugar phosphate isomerase/epimerase